MSLTTVLFGPFNGYMSSIIILASSVVLLVCWQKLSVKLDPREPPLLKPRIPYIGHIIGILRYHTAYFDDVFAKSPMPICTFPMINSKVYVITEPSLVQSAFRSKGLAFEPFISEAMQPMSGLSEEAMAPFKYVPKDEKEPNVVRDHIKAIHTAVLGDNLRRLNADALDRIAAYLNGVESIQRDSLYLWIREMLTLATCNALLGSHSPFIEDPSLVDDLWAFEGGMLGIIMNVLPSVTAPAAHRGRTAIQKALIKYYEAEHDKDADVSVAVRGRAACYREYNITNADIGRLEITLLNVATGNAIPSAFWLLCHICAEPSLAQSIRDELSTIISHGPVRSNGKREIALDITKLDSACPLLISSYREVIRTINSHLVARRVMKDTIISDGKTEYLLKKGYNVQMPAGVAHLDSAIWGPDYATFKADRFVKTDSASQSEEDKLREKVQKKAYFPFGGGRNLCPGRNFAFAEILGSVAVLVLGFEVESKEGGLITVPEKSRAQFAESVGKPRGKSAEMGARISKRKGWEDVTWKFVC